MRVEDIHALKRYQNVHSQIQDVLSGVGKKSLYKYPRKGFGAEREQLRAQGYVAALKWVLSQFEKVDANGI